MTLAMLTFGRDKAMAGAMGSMYMDAMQYRKEREGVDELKAADTALLTGMADYYLENLGYRHISRCVEEGVRKSLVRKIGESFLTGAGMALGSETGGQLIDWMLNGRLSEWGKIYNAHLDEGMSETEAFGEMVKAVGPELTVHTVAGGISGAGFAVIHMLAASKDNRPRKQETIEKTNQEGERNRNESGKYSILSYEDAENIAFDAIHGPNNADAVVLGKYGDGGPTAYTSVAKDMDAQYFQLDNWDELAARYSEDELWKINEKFLDIQTSSGREIYLSHNPEEYLGKEQFYSRELQYLLDNGYKFVDEGGIWHAVR